MTAYKPQIECAPFFPELFTIVGGKEGNHEPKSRTYLFCIARENAGGHAHFWDLRDFGENDITASEGRRELRHSLNWPESAGLCLQKNIIKP